MKLEKYEIQIGDRWHTVRGYVNPKGWLEWKDKDDAQGLKPTNSRPFDATNRESPGTFRRKKKKGATA